VRAFLLIVAALTLGKIPLEPGEILQVIVPAAVRTEPRVSAGLVRDLAAGAEVEVLGARTSDGLLWAEVSGGFVEMARLDRIPAEVTGLLPAGGERMAAGRMLDWSYEPSDLVEVPRRLRADGYEWRAMRLRRDALRAFERMIDAAAREDLTIRILSAYRDAHYQHGLYTRAVARDVGQSWSAPPGRSEHQLGTAADIAVPRVPVLDVALEGTPAYEWIVDHAAEFGVVVTYSRERHVERGVAFEPWHLRWVGDAVDDPSAW